METRTPFNTMPISLVYRSIDRKVFRDQYCMECGKPFLTISDKFVTIIDSATPMKFLRTGDKIIESRCKYHYCKQRYRIEI